MSDRAQLAAWRQMVATICDRATKLALRARAWPRCRRRGPTAELHAKWGRTFIAVRQLVEAIDQDAPKPR